MVLVPWLHFILWHYYKLTNLPLVPKILVDVAGHHWFWKWLDASSTPSQDLNQCCVIVDWTLRNKLQWTFNQNTKLFIHENAAQNIVCEMAAILSRRIWINSKGFFSYRRHIASICTISILSIICQAHQTVSISTEWHRWPERSVWYCPATKTSIVAWEENLVFLIWELRNEMTEELRNVTWRTPLIHYRGIITMSRIETTLLTYCNILW